MRRDDRKFDIKDGTKLPEKISSEIEAQDR